MGTAACLGRRVDVELRLRSRLRYPEFRANVGEMEHDIVIELYQEQTGGWRHVGHTGPGG